jgi:hypothetical protein
VELVETLRDHERAWNERPLLRRIYRDWFALMASRLSDVPGPTVELGSRHRRASRVHAEPRRRATSRRRRGPTWSSTPSALPFADGELANIVMLDVYHHLREPRRSWTRRRRSLRGGRVVMLEPYVSPSRDSRIASTTSGSSSRLTGLQETDRPIPWTRTSRRRRSPSSAARRVRPPLAGASESSTSVALVLVYPLSGGFTKRPLLPARSYRPLIALERALTPRSARRRVPLPRRARDGRSAGDPRSSRQSRVAAFARQRSSRRRRRSGLGRCRMEELERLGQLDLEPAASNRARSVTGAKRVSCG